MPLSAGVLAELAALNVMNWWDPVRNIKATDNARFGVVREVVDSGSGLSPITAPFFDYLAWSSLGAACWRCSIGFVTRIRLFGYLTAAIGVFRERCSPISHMPTSSRSVAESTTRSVSTPPSSGTCFLRRRGSP